MRKTTILILSFAVLMFICSDPAFASSIAEFEGPLEKVKNTITGPGGAIISTILFAVVGVAWIMNKDSLDGGMKHLMNVAFGISFIAFAGSIIGNVFTFSSGALI